MTDFATTLATAARQTPVILDHHDYTARVILRGAPTPYADTAAYLNYFGQAQGLLRPDFALLDIGRLLDHVLDARPDLVTAMGARTRTGFALKTLLADGAAATTVTELVTTVASTSRQPVVLQIPSPLAWLATTTRCVGGDLSAIQEMNGDNASVYVADWLRRFAEVPVGLLLLDARRREDQPVLDDRLDLYSPILNTAGHYRWPVAIRHDDRVDVAGEDLRGSVLPEEYWTHPDHPTPEADFLLAQIPADAQPEDVLRQLTELD